MTGFEQGSWGRQEDHGWPPGEPGAAAGDGRQGRRWRRTVAAFALTAALSGAAGGAVVAVADRDHPATAAVPVASASAAPVAASNSDIQAVLSAIEPSVVNVTTTVQGNGFGQFGGGGSGAGTGIVVGASGEVVTNAHVVADASSIRVQVPGRSGSVAATLVGADQAADLAVIKLQGVSGLPVARFAASSTVHVGDQVVAVGNAEGYGRAPTVTEGIVSALNRDLPGDSGTASGTLHGLLQTDAAINPGNSGGALVDTAGRVVGITTAVASGSRSQPAQNIGFAIPSDTVLKALPALKAGKRTGGSGGAGTSSTGYLGVELSADQAGGALVGAVQPGSPAAAAGLQAGDVITAADGTTVGGPADLQTVLAKHRPGDRVKVSWQRAGQTRSATVTLASRPSSTG
jgi:putative serine protease PepD